MKHSLVPRYSKYLLLILFFIGLGTYKVYRWFRQQSFAETAAGLYVDFDQSMQKQNYLSVLDKQFANEAYACFKQIYAHNNLQKVVPSASVRIPKIIHQIWLGSPLPDEFKAYQQSWIKYHPGWEYKLWTDEQVKQLKLLNQDLFDASINYGEKSDILRYELLLRFGGLYADMDFECLRPMDLLHHCYDLYVGIQPLDTNNAQLGIGLIGAVPGHPLLQRCIEHIRLNTTRQVIARTGPIHFTRMFCLFAGEQAMSDIALPASYLYPCGYNQKGQPPSVWRRPESFAVHHWAGSWLKPEGFVKRP